MPLLLPVFLLHGRLLPRKQKAPRGRAHTTSAIILRGLCNFDRASLPHYHRAMKMWKGALWTPLCHEVAVVARRMTPCYSLYFKRSYPCRVVRTSSIFSAKVRENLLLAFITELRLLFVSEPIMSNPMLEIQYCGK